MFGLATVRLSAVHLSKLDIVRRRHDAMSRMDQKMGEDSERQIPFCRIMGLNGCPMNTFLHNFIEMDD